LRRHFELSDAGNVKKPEALEKFPGLLESIANLGGAKSDGTFYAVCVIASDNDAVLAARRRRDDGREVILKAGKPEFRGLFRS